MTVMYFASVVDKATVDSKVVFQLITQPPKVNTYLLKDILLSKSLA